MKSNKLTLTVKDTRFNLHYWLHFVDRVTDNMLGETILNSYRIYTVLKILVIFAITVPLTKKIKLSQSHWFSGSFSLWIAT